MIEHSLSKFPSSLFGALSHVAVSFSVRFKGNLNVLCAVLPFLNNVEATPVEYEIFYRKSVRFQKITFN